MFYLLLLISFIFFTSVYNAKTTENALSLKNIIPECPEKSNLIPGFILYDVNPYEGFNLRRDVYMRMAIFLYKLRFEKTDWHLVLPPWCSLRHWMSEESETGSQNLLPWGLFFDIESLRKFAPVMEFSEYIDLLYVIDNVIILQNYKEFFRGNWGFEEKWSFESCHDDITDRYERRQDGTYNVNLWGYENMTAKEVKCVSFQGSTDQLNDIIFYLNTKSIFIDHAEVTLHDTYGDRTYWECRKSMKFNKKLKKVALNFIKKHLDVSYSLEKIKKPPTRSTQGGSYVAAHLRRRDFHISHREHVPSIKNAGKQIKSMLSKLKVGKVFIATDGTEMELADLMNVLKPYKVIFFNPSSKIKKRFKDGGIAIIDQLICSYARSFIGTDESTFTFRIQEEREIYGFPSNSTFNTFCPDENEHCLQSIRWTIVN